MLGSGFGVDKIGAPTPWLLLPPLGCSGSKVLLLVKVWGCNSQRRQNDLGFGHSVKYFLNPGATRFARVMQNIRHMNQNLNKGDLSPKALNSKPHLNPKTPNSKPQKP